MQGKFISPYEDLILPAIQKDFLNSCFVILEALIKKGTQENYVQLFVLSYNDFMLHNPMTKKSVLKNNPHHKHQTKSKKSFKGISNIHNMVQNDGRNHQESSSEASDWLFLVWRKTSQSRKNKVKRKTCKGSHLLDKRAYKETCVRVKTPQEW
ncbi:CLUMA_CG016647, isoform A [Clunio marinus]|uniref:CLUMA_CG016647, isoform A n=1 Tax=Clunio marinus TaxID=568069 RepID=A0A1J1ITT5_9DIPT|nr:CLUMA_CG016647, isoform A [Clunio marinus]